MRIALGQDVFSHDDVKVGKVDRLVLNDRTHHVEEFVVHKGVVFSSDKLVDRSMIDRIESDGVHLNLDAANERVLPDFYKGMYYDLVSTTMWPYLSPMQGGMPGALLSATPAIAGREYRGTDDYFEVAPMDGVSGRPESNLSDDDVVIGKGAVVMSADHHRVGHVHAADYDSAGVLTGIVIRSGHLHKQDIAIPANWIAYTGATHVRLNNTAAQVKAAAATAAIGSGSDREVEA